MMIPVEEVCKLANDHYQRVLLMPVIQHTRTLFSQHDVAWRDGDKIRCVGRGREGGIGEYVGNGGGRGGYVGRKGGLKF